MVSLLLKLLNAFWQHLRYVYAMVLQSAHRYLQSIDGSKFTEGGDFYEIPLSPPIICCLYSSRILVVMRLLLPGIELESGGMSPHSLWS